LAALLETGRFHIDMFGAEYFEDLKAHLPELEQATGMSIADYARWLHERRRIDNPSNMFEYIRYVIARDGE